MSSYFPACPFYTYFSFVFLKHHDWTAKTKSNFTTEYLLLRIRSFIVSYIMQLLTWAAVEMSKDIQLSSSVWRRNNISLSVFYNIVMVWLCRKLQVQQNFTVTSVEAKRDKDVVLFWQLPLDGAAVPLLPFWTANAIGQQNWTYCEGEIWLTDLKVPPRTQKTEALCFTVEAVRLR